jgi:hypothetical protein
MLQSGLLIAARLARRSPIDLLQPSLLHIPPPILPQRHQEPAKLPTRLPTLRSAEG